MKGEKIPGGLGKNGYADGQSVQEWEERIPISHSPHLQIVEIALLDVLVETHDAVFASFHADGFIESHGDDGPKGRADDDQLKVTTIDPCDCVENGQN